MKCGLVGGVSLGVGFVVSKGPHQAQCLFVSPSLTVAVCHGGPPPALIIMG